MAGLSDITRTIPIDNVSVLEPVIKELVRTEVCSKPLQLLVDKIIIMRLPQSGIQRCEAYRLWLSDGEKMIQAVLRSEMHPFITAGEIHEGSYVEITKYKIDKSNRRNGKGYITFLLVADLYPRFRRDGIKDRVFTYDYTSFGSQTSSLRAYQAEVDRLHAESRVYDSVDENLPASEDTLSDTDAVDLVSWYNNSKFADKSPEGEDNRKEYKRKKRKFDEIKSPLRPVDVNASPRPTKSRKSSQTQSPARARNVSRFQERRQSESTSVSSRPLLPVLRPLRVTPLADVTGLKASRNKIKDICAVVYSVDPKTMKRKGGSDILRQLRLIDRSTKKKVLFSTFIDPTDFMPSPGTVALFRSVTTHEWDGGSLNAYHRDCGGRDWFIPDPVGVPGCDVEGLRVLWKEFSALESIDTETIERDAPLANNEVVTSPREG